MIYFKLFLIASAAASTIMNIYGIDQPMDPVTRELASVGAIINGLIIAGILYFF